ncbi:hypothetical protein [Propionicimonas sp. T2.31MG-18]|uniref:hypothetical protein n=1 Tax=Propionicimonas sp. T2.31MG-18 TaxID=3157620 RepID=UPI003671F597
MDARQQARQTIANLTRDALERSGLDHGYVAYRIGIRPDELERRLDGHQPWTPVRELIEFCKLVGTDWGDFVDGLGYNSLELSAGTRP